MSCLSVSSDSPRTTAKMKALAKDVLGFKQFTPTSYFVVLVVTVGLVGICALFAFFAIEPGYSHGLFNGHGDVFSDFPGIPYRPTYQGYAINWGLSMVLMILLAAYALYSLVTTNALGPIIMNPPVFTPAIFVTVDVGLGATIAWFLIFDQSALPLALGVQIFAALVFVLASGLLAYRFNFYRNELRTNSRYFDLFMLLISLNGLAMMAGWMTYLSFVVAAMVFSGLHSLVVLFTLFAISGVWGVFFILDVSFLEPFSRFVLTPYIAVLVALTTSLFGVSPYDPTVVTARALRDAILAVLVVKMVVSYYNDNLDTMARRKSDPNDAYKILEYEDAEMKQSQKADE